MKCVAYDRRFVDHVENAHSTAQDVVAEPQKAAQAVARRTRSQRGSTRKSSLATPEEDDLGFCGLQAQENGGESDGGLSYVSEGEETAGPARF
jgi:hypothetical protein